jgi:uncharacterized membrane protein YsdA (DUF1294 family)/cold shock CspA family protein
MRIKGKITHWNEQKGYGFITPAKGAKQVFVHINAFVNRQRRPELNESVSFSMSTDQQGRPCAAQVRRAGETSPKTAKFFTGFITILIAVAFIAFVKVSVVLFDIPVQILYFYLATSALTLLLYSKDKWAAKRDAWRTEENTLHLLSLLGGWPGALIAQQTLRHKSRKEEFRLVFWITVVLNCCAFGWLFTKQGAVFLGF